MAKKSARKTTRKPAKNVAKKASGAPSSKLKAPRPVALAGKPINAAALRSVAAIEAANPSAPAAPQFIDVPSTAVGTAVQASVSIHHATRVTAVQISPGMFRVTRE